MNRKTITIYSLIISIVFVLAVGSFCSNVAKELKNGNKRTQRVFKSLTESVKKSSNFDIDQIKGSLSNYQVLFFYKNNECIYAYPDKYSENVQDSAMIKVYRETFNVKGDSYSIIAAMYTIRPQVIYHYARLSFMVIFVATLLTILLIAYLTLVEKGMFPLFKIKYKEDDDSEPTVEITKETKADLIEDDETVETANSEENTENETIGNTEEIEKEETIETVETIEEDPYENLNVPTQEEISDFKQFIADSRAQNAQKEAMGESEEEFYEELRVETLDEAHNEEADNDSYTQDEVYEEIVAEPTDESSETDAYGQIYENDNLEESSEPVESEAASEITPKAQEPIDFDTIYDGTPMDLFSEDNIRQEIEEENEAKSLFSPVTGFCLESNLKSNLTDEITNAGANEQDLSLMIIKVIGLRHENEDCKPVCEYLLNNLEARNKTFEFGEDSFASILTRTTIEDAELKADAIYQGLSEIIGNKEDIYIGISSKSIRLLSADRLILEANEALKHAMEDAGCPIIGFHVDLDKYKDFINNC